MKKTSPLIRMMLCLLILLVLPSCLWHSWYSVQRCHHNAQAGETTVWQVKRRCGKPDIILRSKNTVLYFYAQCKYDRDWLENHDTYEMIEFRFSLDGKLVSTDKAHACYPLPWEMYDDPFDGGDFYNLFEVVGGSYSRGMGCRGIGQ